MLDGIRLENGENIVDLNNLPKNANGDLIVNNISSLKLFIEEGVSFDSKSLQIMDNNSDIRISISNDSGENISSS